MKGAGPQPPLLVTLRNDAVSDGVDRHFPLVSRRRERGQFVMAVQGLVLLAVSNTRLVNMDNTARKDSHQMPCTRNLSPLGYEKPACHS